MNEKKKPILGQEAVTDARTLGTPRMLILGLQHLFAMFGATVLVPILVQGYGLPLSIQTTLLMAGLGTLLFHVCTKFKVPAFLGSSFAYLGGFSTVASMPAYDGLDPELKLHDFRRVPGERQVNLIFDVVVPAGYRDTADLEKKLSAYAKTLDERNRCVIHFDLDYYNG